MINKTKRNKQVPKEIVEGRVIKNTGNSYIVKNFNGQEFNCKVKGNFRIKGIRTTNPVAVGDIVKFNKSADDVNFIEEYEIPGLCSPNGRALRFDFAVLDDDGDIDFLIEYQGKQHYQPVSKF